MEDVWIFIPSVDGGIPCSVKQAARADKRRGLWQEFNPMLTLNQIKIHLQYF